MRMRAIWMLGLALLLAVGSVYLARNWLENQVQPVIVKEQKAPEIPITKVVVAGTGLQFGNVLRREHIRLADWPAAAVPPGSFTSIDELLDGQEERVVMRPIEPNEPILKSKVSGFGGRAILSSMIAPKMRAMTIRINDVTGVAGFVLPGDRVDMILTRERGGSPITDILLQNIKVLGIDQDANQNRQSPGVVRAMTFEVTPTQSQKLVLAQQVGTLSLALRHTTNVEAIQPQTVSLRDLRVGEANIPQQPEPTSMQLTEAVAEEAPTKIVPKKVVRASQPAKPVVVGSRSDSTVVTRTNKKDPLSAVRIVRALQSTRYEVQPEETGAAANVVPINLLKGLSREPTTVPESPAVTGDGGATN